jgi:hypothetical protein
MSSRRWTQLAAVALVVALAYWAGRRQADGHGSAPSQVSAAARPLVIERNLAGGLDSEELRAVVREELALAQRSEHDEPDPEPIEPSDPVRAAKVAQAASSASHAIEVGIADGLWDERDRDALREQLPYLGERETHAVLSPLFQAINAQRVKLDGPPI